MEYRYKYQGKEYIIQLEPRPGGLFAATIGDRSYMIEVKRSKDGQTTLTLDGERIHTYAEACDTCKSGSQLRYVALVDREARVYELERVRETASRHAKGSSADSLIAQMPGQVRQVLVSEGDQVESGQPMLILEAMKMEIRISAPHAGTVAHLYVQQGQTVERGQQLAEVVSSEE
jgi:biotin carboxyl carrier protein